MRPKSSFLFILLFLQTFIIQAQDQLNLNKKNWEPGKCFSFHVLVNPSDSIPLAEERFFKINPPRWDTIQKMVTEKPAVTQRILIQEAYTGFVIRDFSQHEAGAATGTYLSICHLEYPAKYQTVTFSETDTLKIFESYQLAELPKITPIDQKYFPEIPYDTDQSYGALIQEDQLRYFKLKKGNWSAPREIYKGCYGSNPIVKQVQEKLIELGYKLEPNNILGHKTKIALTDYQKKWDLPVGTLNMETLRALEINY